MPASAEHGMGVTVRASFQAPPPKPTNLSPTKEGKKYEEKEEVRGFWVALHSGYGKSSSLTRSPRTSTASYSNS